MLTLKELVVKKDKDGKEIVPLEDFAKMLEWFGPLENGAGILKRIETRLRTKGFFGMMETIEAEKKLNGASKGTYLIRFSSGNPGAYAITVLGRSVKSMIFLLCLFTSFVKYWVIEALSCTASSW